jgi:adenine-specific DNA-methyltransferase
VQIGDENVHRVRAVIDEVFGDKLCSEIVVDKTSAQTTDYVSRRATLSLVCEEQSDQYRNSFGAKAETKAFSANTVVIEMNVRTHIIEADDPTNWER